MIVPFEIFWQMGWLLQRGSTGVREHFEQQKITFKSMSKFSMTYNKNA